MSSSSYLSPSSRANSNRHHRHQHNRSPREDSIHLSHSSRFCPTLSYDEPAESEAINVNKGVGHKDSAVQDGSKNPRVVKERSELLSRWAGQRLGNYDTGAGAGARAVTESQAKSGGRKYKDDGGEGRYVRPTRVPSRPCRFCGGVHWDSECNERSKAKADEDEWDEEDSVDREVEVEVEVEVKGEEEEGCVDLKVEVEVEEEDEKEEELSQDEDEDEDAPETPCWRYDAEGDVIMGGT